MRLLNIFSCRRLPVEIPTRALSLLFAGASVLCAQVPNTLPLADGNQWVLKSPYVSTPITFQVTSDQVLSGGTRKISVSYTNPWSNYSYVLTMGAAGPLLDGVTIGGSTIHFVDALPWFGTSVALNATWSTAFGPMTLISTTASVTTPAGSYANCWHYQIGSGSSVQDWFLAPNVGFVQFGVGPAAFTLNTVHLTPYVAPVLAMPVSVPCSLVGIDANPAANTNFSAAAQNAASQLAVTAGARFEHLSALWSDLEPSPGAYSFSGLQSSIAYAAAYKMSVDLTIRTIDTNQVSIPADLAGRALNDPVVISRFQAMLAALAPKLTSTVKWVQLGNEVDIYFSQNMSVIPAFMSLYSAGASTLKAERAGTSVGVVFSYSAYWYNNAAFLAISPYMDHIAFTYYPIRPDYTVHDPSIAMSDLGEMISAANGRPMVLTEVGYPSSTVIASSNALQSTFYSNVLNTVQGLSGRVAAVNFFQMSDMPTATVNSLVAYYSTGASVGSAQAFGAYLGSLGTVDVTGTGKPAWTAFAAGASKFLAPVCTNQ
jgi:hypothetical protein